MKKSILYSILLACASFAAHAAQDLTGIRLGMTEEEVVAALKVQNPSLIISKQSASFQYSDGTKTFQTPKFLTKLSANNFNTQNSKDLGSEVFEIDFAGGPSTSKVVGVSRSMQDLPKLISHELFYKSVMEKYGKISVQSLDNPPSEMMWVSDAKPYCSYGTAYDLRFYQSFDIVRSDFRGSVKFIETLKRSKKIVNDLSECGVFLNAKISSKNGLAKGYSFYLFDPGSYMKNSYAQQAWVNKLAEDATNKIKGTGVAPKI